MTQLDIALNPLSAFGERTQALFQLVGYTPTFDQAKVLSCPARSIIVTGGIQAGKSTINSKKLLKEFVPDLRRALEKANKTGASSASVLPLIYWLVGADYDATEREFRYIESDFQALGILRRTVGKFYPGTLDIMGGSGIRTVVAQIKTKSAKDYQTLRKEAPSGIIGCEASQLDLFAFERLIERMAPAQAWMMLSGTMERGHGWYKQLAQEWGIAGPDKAWFQLKSSGNTYSYPGGEENPELIREREEMPASLYEERFEGIPQKPSGIGFPEFQPDLHISAVDYIPGLQVQIWEDPGYGSDSAHVILAVQIVEDQIRVIDEIYVNQLTTDTIIYDILRQKQWYKDVEVRVPDPHYSSQHHGGESVNEIWRKIEPHIRIAPNRRERINPRLERIRSMLLPTVTGAPKVVIHPQCHGILSEVGLCVNPIDKREHIYSYKIGPNGEVLGYEPVDRYNHAWEAFGRGVYWNFGPVGTVGRGKKRKFRSQFFGGRRR